MGVKPLDEIDTTKQLDVAEKFFGCKLPGYVAACTAAYGTVQLPIIEAVGKIPLPQLFNTVFAAGFIAGSLFAQGKDKAAMDWLEKQRPGLGDG